MHLINQWRVIMPGMGFFRSRPSLIAGISALCAGAGASYALAFRVANFFSEFTGHVDEIGPQLTFPALNLTIVYDGEDYILSFNNITVVLPQSLTHLIGYADYIPQYAFYSVLTLGLMASGLLAWNVSNSVAIYTFAKKQQEQQALATARNIDGDTATIDMPSNDDDTDEEDNLLSRLR